MVARRLIALLGLALCCAAPQAAALSMKLQASGDECFYEDVKQGIQLHGSFEVMAGGNMDVDVTIFGPGDTVHYTVQQRPRGQFVVQAPSTGVYRVCFENKASSSSEKVLAFAIHVGETIGSVNLANKEHLTPLQEEVAKLSDSIASVQDEQHYMHQRERVHRDTNESTNARVLWFTFLEAAALVVMSGWQIWSILSQFETRQRY